ncbi:C-GCAxxG-C-C family protein [Chloroflexota bacterium]
MSEERVSLQQAKRMSKEEQKELISKVEKLAHDTEVTYWACSQAVLSALQRCLDIGDGGAFKAATSLTGGVTQGTEACGALVGGVMAIGLAYGRAKYTEGKTAHEEHEYMESLLRTQKFCGRFKGKFGSLRCCDIWGVVRGPDYKKYDRFNTLESFLDHDKCGDVTGPAARLAAEVILEPTEYYAAGINAELADLKQAREEQKSRS